MATTLIGCLQYIATMSWSAPKATRSSTPEQLTPAFGLDIFIPAHGILLAILNFFSIFEIWSLVIFGLALAALTGAFQRKSLRGHHARMAAISDLPDHRSHVQAAVVARRCRFLVLASETRN